ncbi:hypothetical protein KKA47_07615 [bacterium]|nr:hypothetical protein [bacterium]
MEKKTALKILFLVLPIVFIGCYHPTKAYTVKSYKNQKVFIQNSGSYRVGRLSEKWVKKSVGVKVVNFFNEETASSVATTAYCGDYFEDQSARVLSSQLMSSLTNRKIVSYEKLQLDERGAVRTISTAELDGVSFKLDTVVISKDCCVFDFIYIAPIETYDLAVKDFESFFKAFQY